MALSLVGSTTPVRGASRTSFQSVSTTSLALTHRVAPLPTHQSAVSNVRLATLRALLMTCILESLPTLWATVWRIFRLRLWPMGLWKLLLKCILTSSLTNQVSVAHEIGSLYSCHYIIINPRHACAARVTYFEAKRWWFEHKLHNYMYTSQSMLWISHLANHH